MTTTYLKDSSTLTPMLLVTEKCLTWIKQINLLNYFIKYNSTPFPFEIYCNPKKSSCKISDDFRASSFMRNLIKTILESIPTKRFYGNYIRIHLIWL